MARKGITSDQVSNAADAIKARGLTPTITAIRQELGNEGSFSTISQHLAKWKAEADAQQPQKDLPETVENAALEAIAKVWQVAVREANEETKAIQQAAKEQYDALAEELAEARREIEALETVNETLSSKLHETDQQREKLENKVLALQGENAAQRQAYDALLERLEGKKRPAKPQPKKAAKQADTKPAQPKAKPAAPENKPAANH